MRRGKRCYVGRGNRRGSGRGLAGATGRRRLALSLANQLTLIRIVAVVPLMVALYLPFEWARWAVLAMYVGAILTDYFDGIVARRSNEVTGLRQADGLHRRQGAHSLGLRAVGEGSMAAWMAAIMVIREFAVTGLRMVASRRGDHRRQPVGKAKMNAQSIAVFILPGRAGGSPAGWRGVLSEVGWWAMLVAVVLTLLSGWST